METQNPRIKPLLNHSFCIKNMPRYHSFLIKRPKTTLSLKFLQDVNTWFSSRRSDRKIQTKLHKALKLLKAIKKLDLSEYQAQDKSISQAKLLSIFKRVSKAKVISMIKVRDLDHLEKGFTETWLRYLPHILHLSWGLRFLDPQLNVQDFVHRQSPDPLRYLKYCPKIKSLKVNQSISSEVFLQQALQFKRYPSSLRRLDVKARLRAELLNLSFKHFQGLKSLAFTADYSWTPFSTFQIMDTLSRMENLQEIDFQFLRSLPLEIDMIFEKIFQRGILKKIQLEFDSEISNSQKIFQALKTCPLTHFSLRVPSMNDKMLGSISNFLEDMDLLETLKLSIGELCYSPPPEPINKKISKLQNLRHLELSFKSQWRGNSYREINHFIPNLPINLETFHFECTQIDSTKAFDRLITLLEGSYDSLQKLTIILESHSPFEESRQKILAFLRKLQNIQELRLPCLKIASLKFTNDIARVVQALKYLCTFQIGKILNQLQMVEFLPVLRMILKKIGLREFYCFTEPNFLKEVGILRGDRGFGSIMNGKEILKVNPYLERVDFSLIGYNANLLFEEIQNW